MIDIRCPHCNRVHKAPETLVGKKVRCKDCLGVFRVESSLVPGGLPSAGPAPSSERPSPPPPAPRPLPGAPAAPAPSPTAPPPRVIGRPEEKPPVSDRPAKLHTAPVGPVEPPRAQVPPNSEAIYVKPPPKGRGKRLAFLLIALLVAAGGLTAAYYLLVGGSGVMPGWARAYVPEETGFVAYINMDKLRSSVLYQDLEKSLSGPIGTLMNQPATGGAKRFALAPADMSEVFLAGKTQGFVAVIRTTRDLQPGELFTGPAPAKKTYNRKEYLQFGPPPAPPAATTTKAKLPLPDLVRSSQFVVQTGPRTFCLCDSEPVLKGLLDRLDLNQKAELDPKLESMLAEVRGCDHFIAVSETGMVAGGEAFSAGLRLNGTVRLDVSIHCKSEDEAASRCGQSRTQLDQARADLANPAKTPAPLRPIADKLRTLSEGVSFDQSGRKFLVHFKSRSEDVRDVLGLLTQQLNALIPLLK